MAERVSVLFVCLGNICRSPTAEGVFRHLVAEEGLGDRIVIDSAGTGGWHVGSPPDERAVAAARRRGYDLSGFRARRLGEGECAEHDYVIVMDSKNHEAVKKVCPQENIHRLLDFAPNQKVRDVPDPYYGAESDFDEVLDLIEEASRGLLAHLQVELGVTPAPAAPH